MLEKFDEFKQKKQQLDNQQADLKNKLGGIKKQKLQIKYDKFNKQKEDIKKRMSKFVAGSSSFD
jgi:hypothetical protein